MAAEDNPNAGGDAGAPGGDSPGLGRLVRQVTATLLGALRNRGELFAVEWQEEMARRLESVVLAVTLICLVNLSIILLTGIIIFLFPAELRLYVAGGFALLYLVGAGWAWLCLKSLLQRRPFAETLEQIKKDREWLNSLD